MTRRGSPRALAGGVLSLALALTAGCTGTPAPAPSEKASPPATTSSTTPTTESSVTPSGAGAGPAPSADSPGTVSPVSSSEITGLRLLHDGRALIDARSSGLARYNTSSRCEVPNQPCYDAPTFDQIARIDVGAPPTVPGTDTTFVTGHANRFEPIDAAKGVFSPLQQTLVGDQVVVTTKTGIFAYAVTDVLRIPFDQLTTTDEVVRVRADTLVAIGCEIAPDRSSYLGNIVVIGRLRSSTPR